MRSAKSHLVLLYSFRQLLILPFSNCENDYRCLPVILTYTQNLISDFIRELAQLTPGDEPCYTNVLVHKITRKLTLGDKSAR